MRATSEAEADEAKPKDLGAFLYEKLDGFRPDS
jgi:hypothetical protein